MKTVYTRSGKKVILAPEDVTNKFGDYPLLGWYNYGEGIWESESWTLKGKHLSDTSGDHPMDLMLDENL